MCGGRGWGLGVRILVLDGKVSALFGVEGGSSGPAARTRINGRNHQKEEKR